jgi:hypothetical protein
VVIKAYVLIQANRGKTGSVVKRGAESRVIGSNQAIDGVSTGHPSPWSMPGQWHAGELVELVVETIGEAMKEVRR